MNALVGFRLCKLSDQELADKVDGLIDSIYESDDVHGILVRHIPARPDKDFDLLVGELIYRFNEKIKNEVKKRPTEEGE